MGREARRDPEEGGLTPRSPLFLFDENVTPVGRALTHVYDVVVVSEDTDGLGRGADDEEHIIPWCVANNAVWVTKDWQRKRNPEMARQLQRRGVSVAWFRPRRSREATLRQLLAAAAIAMPKLIDFYRKAGTRYVTIDDRGQVHELPLHIFVKR